MLAKDLLLAREFLATKCMDVGSTLFHCSLFLSRNESFRLKFRNHILRREKQPIGRRAIHDLEG